MALERAITRKIYKLKKEKPNKLWAALRFLLERYDLLFRVFPSAPMGKLNVVLGYYSFGQDYTNLAASDDRSRYVSLHEYEHASQLAERARGLLETCGASVVTNARVLKDFSHV